MTSFSMLPVRTVTGKVVKEKRFNALLDAGVSLEDAKNIVLGKSKRNWADSMTYMTPVIYRGYGDKKEGIVGDLMKLGLKNPKIRGRVIYLTGSDSDKSNNIKKDSTIKDIDAIQILKNGESGVDIIKSDQKEMFDLDMLIEDVHNLEIDFVTD